MNRKLIGLVSLLLIGLVAQNVWAVDKIEPDPKAVQLVDDLLAALSIEDEQERIAALLPLLHKTLLNDDNSALSADTKRYSYKKAYENVQFYKQPADVTEVHKGNVTTVGYGDKAEKGRTDKYFVNKKDGIDGRPAPIHIFWPDDGSDPKAINIGSL